MTAVLVRWGVAAAVSAYAAAVVTRHGTPIDDALPAIAVLMTVLAALTHPSIQLSVPLLLIGEIVLFDERLRLLWFGLVIGVAFAAVILWSGPIRSRTAAVVITVAAVLLLRWIPLSEVLIGRELIVLAFSVAIVLVLGATPVAIAVAVATALFTTAVPLRTLMVPAGVLALAAVARAAGTWRLRLPVAAATVVTTMMLFFAWSGALARAAPIMLRGGPPSLERIPVRIALAAGESVEIDIPREGKGLIVSGANVPRLRRGTPLGTIQPAGIVVRIGDVADWGVLRREHYYNSRNPLPRRPGGLVRGYGQTAWIDASGRIDVPPGRVTVRAEPTLPRGASLQIDAIELTR
ncbi:MAG TPA: hypothetical protein VM779_09290 [Thermoanaerobaculia bacterium]|nr:hypothetical protein [Thermoanaerobaculia bacterium]